MKNVVDILIVGGGPAGSISAIELTKAGFSVALIKNACGKINSRGETLSPRGLFLLRKFNLIDILPTESFLQSNILRHLWGDDSIKEVDYSFHPYGGWVHLDRDKFDKALLNEVYEMDSFIEENANC